MIRGRMRDVLLYVEFGFLLGFTLLGTALMIWSLFA